MKRGPKQYFTETEDNEIIQSVAKLGLKEAVKVLAIKFGRTRRAIKERYSNTLNPSLTPDFTEEDDIRLLSLIKEFGTSWKNIEGMVGNKSQSQLKSRFATLKRLIARNIITQEGKRNPSYKKRKYNLRRARNTPAEEEMSIDYSSLFSKYYEESPSNIDYQQFTEQSFFDLD